MGDLVEEGFHHEERSVPCGATVDQIRLGNPETQGVSSPTM